MKIKLDENLPAEFIQMLAARGHDVHTVPQESLTGRPDAEIFAAAQAEERVLMTQDLDFSDIRKYSPGSHHGIVLFESTAQVDAA